MIIIWPKNFFHDDPFGCTTGINAPYLRLCLCDPHKVSHYHQIVDRRRKGKHPPGSQRPSMPGLSHQPNGLQPPKDLLHCLALHLTDAVACMPGGPTIKRRAPLLGGHVRGDPHLTQFPNELPHIVPFVSSPRVTRWLPGISSHIVTSASLSAVPVA